MYVAVSGPGRARRPQPTSGKETHMSQKKDPKDTCVLVTGGAGFIGSHTVVELLQDGYQVVIVDDLSNASEKVVDRIDQIVGEEAAQNLTFYKADVNDREAMEAIFDQNDIDRVIHFAGFKAVGESVTKPIEYYSNNLGNTLTLVDVMRNHGCKDIIFSSSATVYGAPDSLPLTEESPKKPATNPYGWTKWMIEQILTDLHTADPEWNVVLLRYFNPIGAHPSGLMGEDPKGIPNNLLPYVAQVAIGKRECVHVFGNDYDTPDGTGVRDYIHVCDLGSGHAAALKWMNGRTGVEIFNLGTGKGTSVLQIIEAFGKACGKKIPYQIDPRRPGDVDANYADCSKAKREMDWEAKYTIDDMCRDSWNWQSKNPNGYEG
jgi:UDP-glucose 4-epimerase